MPDAPLRIQRLRTRGWRMPPNTVSVTRPGRWGNPFTIHEARALGYLGTDRELADMCVEIYRAAARLAGAHAIRGLNLACWCRLCPTHAAGKPFGVQCDACAPCHADVLLEIANGPLRCEAVDA